MELWIIVAIVSVAVIILTLIILKAVKQIIVLQSNNKGSIANQVEVVDGVRYTKSASSQHQDNTVSHRQGDIILERGKVYTVSREGEILPGKYTVLSSNEDILSFNIRLGGLVRDYRHNQSIVIGENEQISAVSHTIILR